VFINVVLASIMVGAVFSLLHAIRVGDRPLEVLSKTAASAAFVALGLARWSAGDPVGAWLIAGLALCAVGDLCLLWDRSFDLGVISFLLGHLTYVTAFSVALPIRMWPPVLIITLFAIGWLVLRWLWPHLGQKKLAVALYVVGISVMLWGGAATLVRDALPWTAGCGAILFYLSDLAVARQRFVHESFLNRALGLPIYYLGQLLLAMTIGAG
jgi:uncharacterized membrane protein YhhN